MISKYENYEWMTRNLITNTSYQVINRLMNYFKSDYKLLEPIQLADGKILIKFDES